MKYSERLFWDLTTIHIIDIIFFFSYHSLYFDKIFQSKLGSKKTYRIMFYFLCTSVSKMKGDNKHEWHTNFSVWYQLTMFVAVECGKIVN